MSSVVGLDEEEFVERGVGKMSWPMLHLKTKKELQGRIQDRIRPFREKKKSTLQFFKIIRYLESESISYIQTVPVFLRKALKRLKAVLWIRDILVWIRIRTDGSCSFRQ